MGAAGVGLGARDCVPGGQTSRAGAWLRPGGGGRWRPGGRPEAGGTRGCVLARARPGLPVGRFLKQEMGVLRRERPPLGDGEREPGREGVWKGSLKLRST